MSTRFVSAHSPVLEIIALLFQNRRGYIFATRSFEHPLQASDTLITRPLVKRGFTLIELMIVVAIIRILARSKQSEAKSNLKSMFTAERSFYQEKDRYSPLVDEIGFSPERANRYVYRLSAACAVKEDRSTATAVRDTAGQDTCISVDLFKYSAMQLMPAYKAGGTDPGAGTIGVINLASCPTCDFIGTAAGDIDSESTGLDSWYVSSMSVTNTASCGN